MTGVNDAVKTASMRTTVQESWQQIRVLVVGDVMLDSYLYGAVERISPEAPVPVVRATRRVHQPGGAANVAMNVIALGAQTTLVGYTGHDQEAVELQSALGDAGVRTQLLQVAGRPTTVKLRVHAGEQPLLRIDTEDCVEHSAEAYAALLFCVMQQLPAVQVVILSDYAKGALSADVCQAIITAARQQGIPVLVDTKQQELTRYRGATTMCPNITDLARALYMDAEGVPMVLARAQQLLGELDLAFMAPTLGGQGIAILTTQAVTVSPSVAKPVSNVTGAGDVVAAVLALSLATHLPPEQAAELANVAAAIAVAKLGTSIALRDELIEALDPPAPRPSSATVLTLAELQGLSSRWRAEGHQIVFTNGCFDLLHVGHIVLLETARRLGDKLIVALNSDSSVRRLKGVGRPLVSEADRARLLTALSCVDAVIVFHEPTPLHLINALRPDVLVKGSDYREEGIAGAAEVRSWGGDVVIVPLVEGISTTSLITGATRAEKPR